MMNCSRAAETNTAVCAYVHTHTHAHTARQQNKKATRQICRNCTVEKKEGEQGEEKERGKKGEELLRQIFEEKETKRWVRRRERRALYCKLY